MIKVLLKVKPSDVALQAGVSVKTVYDWQDGLVSRKMSRKLLAAVSELYQSSSNSKALQHELDQFDKFATCCGGVARACEELGVTRTAPQYWRKAGIPNKHKQKMLEYPYGIKFA